MTFCFRTRDCIVLFLIMASACSDSGSPTRPTPGMSPTVTAITVSGNGRLTATGQTTQLSAEATMSNGSKKDVTSTATWNSSNSSVATVSQTGLVTAVEFGTAGILVRVGAIPGPDAGFTVTVLSEGTYILRGQVWDPELRRLAAVRVETIGGPMSGRATMTDQFGQYALIGVSGVLQVKASKDGYLTSIRDVAQDTGRGIVSVQGIELAPDIPYASVGGSYQLTFKASSSCQLPGNAATRTYTAGINQSRPGLHVLVVLQSGEFLNHQDHFSGLVDGNGNTVSFTFPESDGPCGLDDCGVVEKLGENRYLQFFGTARGTATGSGITAALTGTVMLYDHFGQPPLTVLTCAAPDHQLLFTRATASTSRQTFRRE